MPTISFGPFTFDSDLMSLTRDGQPVSLARPGAALLAAMLDAKGAVVGKNALMEAAWPATIVEEANLTVQVAALRKALGETAERGEWILTVPRVGYRLVRPAADPASVKPVIAVLPFANLSNDPEQAFFADGVVEELTTALSRFKTFAVTARNSTLVYRNKPVDVRVVATELGVRYVLEGSVRRSGSTMRVAAQLVDASTGAHLWADRFEGQGTDIFAFEDQISESVIGHVEPRILKAEIERARRKRPESFDAWDLYVQALPIVQAMTVPAYDQAITLLDRAVALDPGHAPALILAAWAYEKRYSFGMRAAADKVKALALSDRALAADPDDATVLAMAGWFRMILRGDWGAIASCQRAVALNPNNLLVLEFAGVAEFFGGDLDRSIGFYKRALELGPGAPNNYASLAGIAMACGAARRWEECIFWAERAIEIAKGYVYSYLHLACAHAQLGHGDAARAALDAALAVQPDMTIKFATGTPMRFAERQVSFVEGLRKVGLPEA